MIAQEAVGLHNIDVVDLGRLQDLPRAFAAGNVGACPDFSPAIERTGHANLGPDAQNCRHNQIKKEMMTAEADWIEHSCGNLIAFIRRSTAPRVQISNCFGNRERILQPVFVTTTTSSCRTPPSPG